MLFDLIHLPLLILITFCIVYFKRKKINKHIRTLLLIYLATNFWVELAANLLDSNLMLYNAGMIFEVTIFLVILFLF